VGDQLEGLEQRRLPVMQGEKIFQRVVKYLDAYLLG
jgi:hypothetical protein